MTEDTLLIYIIADKALETCLESEGAEFAEALEAAAAKAIKREGLGSYAEGYTGILDDYEVDLGEASENDTAEAVTVAWAEPSGSWLTFSAAEAKKIAKQLKSVTITGDDAENYFDDREVLEDLRDVHNLFRAAMDEVAAGQTLLLRITF